MDLGGVDLSRSAVGQGAGRAKAKGIRSNFLGPTWLCAGVGGFAEGVTCLELSCGVFAFVGLGGGFGELPIAVKCPDRGLQDAAKVGLKREFGGMIGGLVWWVDGSILRSRGVLIDMVVERGSICLQFYS